jgi:hypothetical protein
MEEDMAGAGSSEVLVRDTCRDLAFDAEARDSRLASQGDGPLGGHVYHRKGVDLDVSPLRLDGDLRAVTIHDAGYDRELTGALIQACLCAKGCYGRRPSSLITRRSTDPALA